MSKEFIYSVITYVTASKITNVYCLSNQKKASNKKLRRCENDKY